MKMPCNHNDRYFFNRQTENQHENIIICLECVTAWMISTHRETGEMSTTSTHVTTELDYGEAIDYVIKEYPDQLRLTDLAEMVGMEDTPYPCYCGEDDPRDCTCPHIDHTKAGQTP